MNKNKFVVTGAKRNSAEFAMDNLAGSYKAVIYEIDFDKEQIIQSYVEEKPNGDIYPKEYSFSFRGCSLQDDVIYTSTHSEILKIDRNNFRVVNRISLPIFNDLHHVDIINGKMVFATTGLDHVGLLDNESVELYPSLPIKDCRDIEDGVDYRKISTKPHQSHPNYFFEIESEIWCTRFQQKDAICLKYPEKRMDIGIERPHDGIVVDGKVYFTTVNGSIVVFDSGSLEKLAVHNLQSLYKQPKVGWCRGIDVIGDYAYIGFTRLRKTRSVENLGFITDRWNIVLDSIKNIPPARIIKYDLIKRKIVKEMNFKNSQLSVLFSVKHL